MKFPLKIPPGIVLDDTTFATDGSAWYDCDKVRFWRGRPEVIGGWEKLSLDLVSGVCRTVYPWTDNAGTLNVAFGTHSHLQVWLGGELFDITPLLQYPPTLLGSNRLSATVGSPTITVSQPGHGYPNGTSITVSGAANVGSLTPNGTFTITVVDDDSYTYTFGSNAANTTLANNPLTTTNGSPIVTVSQTAHGLTTGATVTIAGASAVGGITPNGTFPITRIDANSYRYTFTANASSAATGGGAAVTMFASPAGGDAVVIQPQTAFPIGAENGTGGAGYGTGSYSVGEYSEPSTSEYYPRTWSLAAYGESLMANPRGYSIYWWQNDTGVPAEGLQNAPANVTFMLVTPTRQVMAFGCNEELSGEFNPLCIRYSDIEGPTTWATRTDNNAGENILSGGGRIVAARLIGNNIFVWTDNSLYQGTFVGDPGQTWRFDRIADQAGLLGPNAAVVVGLFAYWLGPNFQPYACPLGSQPQAIVCPIQDETFNSVTPAQYDKIVASACAQYREIRFDYPAEQDGLENSRYVSVSLPDNAWSRGQMARSAYVDAGPSPSPIGVSPDGYVYWHERGQSADGAAFNAWVESADQYLPAAAERRIMIRGVWPDVERQIGPLWLTVTTRRYPQDTMEFTRGPYALATNQLKKDFRASGRTARVRFESNSVPNYWRLGDPVFDLTTEGER